VLLVLGSVVLVAGVFFPGPVFRGEVLLPLDLVYFYQPFAAYHAGRFETPGNWILFDEVLEFQPWARWTRHELAAGRVPLWDPQAFCGYPFLAVLQTAVLYPLDRLLDVAPLAAWPFWRALLHLCLLGSGAALLVLELGGSLGGGLLAALALSFGGFSLGWLGHPHFKVWAWAPWLFLLAERYLTRPTRRRGAALALATGLSLLAGHIETSVHVLLLLLVYLLVRVPWAQRRRLGTALVWLGLGCLLSSAVVFPFAEYLGASSAYLARQGGVWVRPTLPQALLGCLFAPRLVGTDAEASYWYPEFNANEVMGGTVGWLPWLLAPLALVAGRGVVRDRRRWALVAVVFFGLSVSFGWPPVGTLFNRLPGMRMAYNFRFLLGVGLGVAVLAGLGLPRGEAGPAGSRRRALRVLGLTVLALLLVTGGSILALASVAAERAAVLGRDLQAELLGEAGRAVLFLVLSALLLGVLLARPSRRRPLAGALLLVLVAELWISFHTHNRAYPPELQQPSTPITEFIGSLDRRYRVLPLGQNLPPHLSIEYGFDDIRGNDALTPELLERYLWALDPEIRAPGLLPAMRLIQLRRFAGPLIDHLAAGYLITCGPGGLLDWVRPGDRVPPGKYEPVFQSGPCIVWRNHGAEERVFFRGRAEVLPDDEAVFRRLREDPEVLRRAVLLLEEQLASPPTAVTEADAPLRIERLERSPQRITLRAATPGPGWIVLSDTWFPGWKATLDGQSAPLLRANLFMRAVAVPGGQVEVTWRYEPDSYRVGLFASLAAALVLTAACAVPAGRP
jgi:hypothetical protein